MKCLTNLMESNKYMVLKPERDYFIVVDHSSFGEGNYQESDTVGDVDEIASYLDDWVWNFKDFWTRKYSDSENILGYTKEELTDWFATKNSDQIEAFLNIIKNLKPWATAQFVINFPKSYIVAATVTKIGQTGLNAKK